LNLLKNYAWCDDWLCTHAGLSNNFFNAYSYPYEEVDEFLGRYSLDGKLEPRLYNCSPLRGGMDAYGGIVWCDYDEFEPIPGVKQIFGHTADQVPKRYNNENICIDTFLMYYAIYDGSKMEIRKV
ncbi:MAG: hypothetical protein GWN01_07025, partial [Nitrosopumilaceae archaeon]|nr:hypothetical protein [Nitrosopumilaceae archaeon]NIU86138.1 hypothetical protein [Nitrosopumilaceae archaeon]NIX61286.1 hypothetical protein [Nitrosopumilaceae archaeon]